MSDPHYDPPRAPLKDGKGPAIKRSNLLAIIIGAVTDTAATTVGGVVLALLFAIFFAPGGMRVEDMQAQMLDSDLFRAVSAAMGLGCSVLGGYVCARFANQNEYANALAVGIIGLLVGELLSSGGDPWLHILAFLTIPAAILGAHIKMRAERREG